MQPFFETKIISPNQKIQHPILQDMGIELFIKREDKIHEFVSGNKFRKLKYNIEEAKKQKHHTILTFGGAYSNHIAATAAAGKISGFNTIGVIRGEELGKDLTNTLEGNPTLQWAAHHGMQFYFISREDYKRKTTPLFIDSLREKFGDFYLIPEGGTNDLAVQGCKEIISDQDQDFDVICSPVGTGGTIAGIINASKKNQEIIGFPALKGDFLSKEISKYTQQTNWKLIKKYHFGGYGKINVQLIEFINSFTLQQKITLDPIYTGKMLFGIFDLIKQGAFSKNTRILAIHTGGLQGVSGMNKMLIKKKLPILMSLEK